MLSYLICDMMGYMISVNTPQIVALVLLFLGLCFLAITCINETKEHGIKASITAFVSIVCMGIGIAIACYQ